MFIPVLFSLTLAGFAAAWDETPTMTASCNNMWTQTPQRIQTETPVAVIGDPHFVGLAGQHFKVIGPPAFFYNLYSSPTAQINTLWFTSDGPSRFTVNSEIGIRFGKDTIYINRQGRLRLNDAPLPRTAEPFYFGDGSAYIVREPEGTPGESGPTIYTPEFTLKIVPRGYEVDLKAFQLHIEPHTQMHGLLGQTWNATGWPASAFSSELTNQVELFTLLEGTLGDYVVKDGLFGSDFVFNQFDAEFGKIPTLAPAYSDFWNIPKFGSFDEAMAAVMADNVDFMQI